jgi:2-polyprenyl-6-methoxyphenol hydroxylase-like FAD-dependent oxidoreductase
MQTHSTSESHALVTGGSMAGLLAARVLADHFDRVTVLERDRLPEGAAPRPGVPQARHAHVLLMRGQSILEQLFPRFGEEMVASGALLIDSAGEIAWLTPAGWGVRFPSSLQALFSSRDMLEWHVRRRVAAHPRIQFRESCEVTGLAANASLTEVTGVRIRSSGSNEQPSGEEERIDADLVVDAGGRRSDAPAWLEGLGYDRPEETVVNAHLGYASRVYRRPVGFRAGWKGLYIQAAPPDGTRFGVIAPIEGDRWIVSLGGGDRDYPPTDEAGFLEFARSLPCPWFYEAIQNAEPLSPISGFRATENRLRHYERLSRLPEGLLVLGDAACAFNPVYGQGMTAAALGAMALDRCLTEQRQRCPGSDLTGLSVRFQKRLAGVTATPWMLATGEDYRYCGTTAAPASWSTRLMHRYVDHVVRLSTSNPGVRRTFMEVFHLISPPQSLFRPGVLSRVLGQAIRPRREMKPAIVERELARST